MKPMFRLWVEEHQRLCHVIYIDFMNRHVQVLIGDDYGHEGPLDVYDVDLEDLEQFTGIQDTQGVNIYEGDIVKVLRGDWLSKDDEDSRTIDQYTYDIASIGRVIFTKGSFTIHLGKDRIGYDIHESLIAQRHGFVRVIGNIHQHAHLLEE